jgi:hypothetical protein
MSTNPSKRPQELREKLRLNFSPKVVATNPVLQPIYDLVCSVLKSTEFWVDLEKAVDATIAEIEQKIMHHLFSVNSISADTGFSRGPMRASTTRNPVSAAKYEAISGTSAKNDLENRSVTSNLERRLEESKKLVSKNFSKAKATAKPVGLPKHSLASRLPKLRKDVSSDIRKTPEDTNSVSQKGLATDLWTNGDFQAKLRDLVGQQLLSDPSLLYRQLTLPIFDKEPAQLESEATKKVAPPSHSFKGSRNFRQISEPPAPLYPVNQPTGLKAEYFSDFEEAPCNYPNTEKRGSGVSIVDFVEAEARSSSKNHNTRYSRKTRGSSKDRTDPLLPLDNMFKAPISEEEKPATLSVSDNPSNESCNSEAHERKLETLKKNIVRRESLSKSAGLAFSFGRVPQRVSGLQENLSISQQISNFE